MRNTTCVDTQISNEWPYTVHFHTVVIYVFIVADWSVLLPYIVAGKLLDGLSKYNRLEKIAKKQSKLDFFKGNANEPNEPA